MDSRYVPPLAFVAADGSAALVGKDAAYNHGYVRRNTRGTIATTSEDDIHSRRLARFRCFGESEGAERLSISRSASTFHHVKRYTAASDKLCAGHLDHHRHVQSCGAHSGLSSLHRRMFLSEARS